MCPIRQSSSSTRHLPAVQPMLALTAALHCPTRSRRLSCSRLLRNMQLRGQLLRHRSHQHKPQPKGSARSTVLRLAPAGQSSGSRQVPMSTAHPAPAAEHRQQALLQGRATAHVLLLTAPSMPRASSGSLMARRRAQQQTQCSPPHRWRRAPHQQHSACRRLLRGLAAAPRALKLRALLAGMQAQRRSQDTCDSASRPPLDGTPRCWMACRRASACHRPLPTARHSWRSRTWCRRLRRCQTAHMLPWQRQREEDWARLLTIATTAAQATALSAPAAHRQASVPVTAACGQASLEAAAQAGRV